MRRDLRAPAPFIAAILWLTASGASAQIQEAAPTAANSAPSVSPISAPIAPLGVSAPTPLLATPLAADPVLSVVPLAAPAPSPLLTAVPAAAAAAPALMTAPRAASVQVPDENGESAARAAAAAAPAAPPAAPDPNATRWLTRFVDGLQKKIDAQSSRPEELSRSADFEGSDDGAAGYPALSRSRTLTGAHANEGWTRVVAFKDESTIVTGGMDGTIRMLDLSDGRLLHSYSDHSGVIRALELSPDKRYLFSADDAGAILRRDLTRPNSRPLVLQEPTGGAVRAFRLSPDGRFLATGEHDGTISLWDAKTGRRARSFDIGKTVYDLVYSEGGKYLLAAGSDGIIRRLDVETGDLVEMAGHEKGARALAVRPGDGLLMSAGEDGTIRSWNVAEAREVGRYDVPDKWVRALAFSADGAAVYSGNINGRIDKLEVGANGKVTEARTLYAHDDVVFQTAVSPKGDFLVTSGRDLRIGVLDSGGDVRQIHGSGGPVHSMFLLKDGTPVGVSHDGNLLIWEKPQGKPLRVESHSKSARALAVSADGAVATGGDDNLVLLRRPGAAKPEVLGGHTGRVRALAFSPDRKTLVSGGDDRVLLLRDARTGAIRQRIAMPASIDVIHALAFSPDGRRLAIGGRDGLVRELDLRKGRLMPAWERRHQGYIRSLAYSRDGKLLATGGRDGSLWLWETRSGRPLKQLKGHSDDVNSVEFDSGRRLLTASDDKTVRLWDLARGRDGLFEGLRPFSSARFSRDGARILAIDDRETLRSFDASNPNP